MTRTDDLLGDDPVGVWEITTANGTRHWLDFAEGRSMRLPAVHGDGPFAGGENVMAHDRYWVTLRMWSACKVGERFTYGASFRDSVLTSPVAAVRRVPEDEVRPHL